MGVLVLVLVGVAVLVPVDDDVGIAYYYMSLYIKSVLINDPQEFAKNVSYSYCSVH